MVDKHKVRQWSDILILGIVIVTLGVKTIAAASPLPQGASGVKYEKNALGMEFVTVPAGEFQMGCSVGGKSSNEEEAGFSTVTHVAGVTYDLCRDDEKPRHAVRITRSFEVGKTEVTQKQWEAAMGSNPSVHQDGVNLPVEFVSFQDVQQFLAKLNATNDGFVYRLPTEAEWEYAARAGTTDEYAGSLEEAWYDDGRVGGGPRAFIGFEGETTVSTHPVATKKPNPWGIYDMRGNVAEWVQDWYDAEFYLHSPAADPKGPAGGDGHIVRGGSWHTYSALTRVSARAYRQDEHQSVDLGIRVVREKR